MLLIVSLAQADVGNLADYAAGADAGLLRIPKLSSGAKAFKEVSQAMSDIPWGGWLGNIGRKGISQVIKAGCDFVVFPAAGTSLTMLQDNETGKILEVEASLGEGLLRAVNELSVDAVLITGEQEGRLLTWHHLMLFQRFADLLAKPLLVSVPSEITAGELQALWGAGVDGVVIEAGAGQPAGGLKELRQTVDSLSFPSPRKRGKAKALLPYMSGEEGTVTEEE